MDFGRSPTIGGSRREGDSEAWLECAVCTKDITIIIIPPMATLPTNLLGFILLFFIIDIDRIL